jgi:hypothetical protein
MTAFELIFYDFMVHVYDGLTRSQQHVPAAIVVENVEVLHPVHEQTTVAFLATVKLGVDSCVFDATRFILGGNLNALILAVHTACVCVCE